MPITAALLACGLSASGIAPVSTMVISSEPGVRPPAPPLITIEPSDLPLVRML